MFERTRTPEDRDFSEIESITGRQLIEPYKNAYNTYSGITFPNFGPKIVATCCDGLTFDEHLQKFLTVDDIRDQWEYIGYLSQFANHFAIPTSFVEPEHLVPLADLSDGCIYVANGGLHAGAVFAADNGDFGIGKLESSVDAFVARMGQDCNIGDRIKTDCNIGDRIKTE